MTSDPERMRFSSSLSPELRRALGDAKDDLPNDRQLAAAAAALAATTATAAATGTAVAASTTSLKIGKLVAILVGAGSVTTAAVIGVVAISEPNEPEVATQAAAPTASELRIPEPTPPEPAPPEIAPFVAPVVEDEGEPEAVEPSERRTPRRVARSERPDEEVAPMEEIETPPEPAGDSADELALLLRARRAARSSPGEALSLVQEHRTRFARSRFAEEREAIAIEALARSGRRAEAQRRADAFRARHPRSIHLRAIDALLPRQTDD
jgi:hypothetical protein